MTTSAGATAEAGATSAGGTPEVDARVTELIAAMVPAVGEAAPTKEQKDLAQQVWKLVEAAQKKAQDKQKEPDEAAFKEAQARFFASDVAGALARKQQEEQDKKDQAQQAAAQKAAGQPVSQHKG